jgi:hypothetical protein
MRRQWPAVPWLENRVRPLVFLAALVATVGLVVSGTAQGKRNPKALPPPPPMELPAHVNYLARQLLDVPFDESSPITEQIQKLIISHLERWIADRAPTDVEVRRELENVFSQLRYPLFGQPAVFAHPWADRTILAAGYTLGWSDYDRVNVVALFESRGGNTRLATVTDFIPRTDIHYQFLPSPEPDSFRFFIYGARLGKSDPRLSVLLYSFDGQTLKLLWETRDLFDGKLEVDENTVVIRYLKEDEYIRETSHGRKPPRHEAIYKITPGGLDLEIDHEVPF